ncbi:MAG: hypothetical protein E4G90_04610 [Gemmatimonadales bacterium]|nr:MAG: hypothetical protein E4G90_04610 [Gemmatimonadales bacterium]
MTIVLDKLSIGTAFTAGGTDTIVLTTTAAVASGATIVVGGGCFHATAVVSSINDSAGNTYTVDRANRQGSDYTFMASAYAPTGLASSSSITLVFSVFPNTLAIGGASFAGVATSSPVEDTNAVGAGSTAAWTTGNIVTSQECVILGHSMADDFPNTPVSTPTSPSVENFDHTSGAGDGESWTMAYRIETAPSTYIVAGTWDQTCDVVNTVGVGYKAAPVAEGRIYKRFYGPAQLTGSAADLYTVPAGKRIRVLDTHVSNPSASAVDLTLSIGTDAAGTRVYDGLSIAADSRKDDFTPYELAAGEKIQGWASSAATLNLTITGYEESV